MTLFEWITVLGELITASGVVYGARRLSLAQGMARVKASKEILDAFESKVYGPAAALDFSQSPETEAGAGRPLPEYRGPRDQGSQSSH